MYRKSCILVKVLKSNCIATAVTIGLRGFFTENEKPYCSAKHFFTFTRYLLLTGCFRKQTISLLFMNVTQFNSRS